MLSDMYTPNYSSLIPWNVAYFHTEAVTIFPYGRCLKFFNYSNPLFFTTKQSIQLFLTDAYEDTYFSLALKSYSGESMNIYRTPELATEMKTFSIQVSQTEKLEYKGECKNYDSVKSYYNCLKTEYRNVLAACVPKWIDDQSLCENMKMTRNMSQYKSFLANLSTRIAGGDSFSMPGCKRSCLTTKIASKQLVYRKNIGKKDNYNEMQLNCN